MAPYRTLQVRQSIDLNEIDNLPTSPLTTTEHWVSRKKIVKLIRYSFLFSSTDYWVAKMDDHRDWFLEDENYAADSKRKSKTTLTRVFGGTEGSFKKLEFD